MIRRHLSGIGFHNRMYLAAHILQHVHVAAVGEHAAKPAALPPHEHHLLSGPFDGATPCAPILLHIDAGATYRDALFVVEWDDDLRREYACACLPNLGSDVFHEGVLDHRWVWRSHDAQSHNLFGCLHGVHHRLLSPGHSRRATRRFKDMVPIRPERGRLDAEGRSAADHAADFGLRHGPHLGLTEDKDLAPRLLAS